MNLLHMEGAWGTLHGMLYEAVVASGCEPLYRRVVEEAARDVPAGTLVLDLGCGGGHATRVLAERYPKCRVLGLDLSPAQVRRARARHGGALDNLEFRQGDAMDIPLPAASASLVCSLASIKHWPDRERGLAEIRRVLVPGGQVGLLEADPRCTGEQVRAFVAMWRHVLPGTRWLMRAYFRRYVAGQGLTLDELRSLAARAGFIEIQAHDPPDMPVIGVTARAP